MYINKVVSFFEMEVNKMYQNAWSVRERAGGADVLCLPADMIPEWATSQSEMSRAYKSGTILSSSEDEFTKMAKQAMLSRIKTTLEERSNLSTQEITTRMAQVDEHLEDPGLLKNFQYFDIPSSDFMLGFYFAVWDRRIADVMGYLHNYGKDLKGIMREVPEDDIWFQMSRYEGMNINERRKSADIVKFILENGVKQATSFGGGDIPERLYGLPANLKLTVFDDGPVAELEELFPEPERRKNINYIHEPLSKALSHADLIGTQDLVWMHGVSMYLNEDEHHEMTKAILCGVALLRDGGYMKYDYLVWTQSMRRVIDTQNWPYDPRNPMVIFNNAHEAIQQGRKTLLAVNAQLTEKKVFIETLDPVATLVEPWGITSVRFAIRKHVN